MATNDSFTKLESTLANESAATNNPAIANHPRQIFCATLHHASAALRSHLSDVSKVLICVDGRPKGCLEGASGNVDTEVRDVIYQLGKDVLPINCAELLGVPFGDVHASASHLETLRSLLNQNRGAALVILGSGSITDLIKHAAFEENKGRPLISIPTALTVTAFSSRFSVLDWNGAKRTKPSRQPDATLWTAPILLAAPQRLNRSGYGDLLAKYSAYGDWYLAHFFGMTSTYNELPFRLMDPFSKDLRELAPAFGQSALTLPALKDASAVLAMAGIAMNAAGETTPLSGFEHVVSHGLDFLRYQSGRSLALHGEQVALGTVASLSCYDWFLTRSVPFSTDFCRSNVEESIAVMRRLIERAPFFGTEEIQLSPGDREQKIGSMKENIEAATNEFECELREKTEMWSNALEKIPHQLSRWDELRSELRRLTLHKSEVERLVAEATLPLSPENLEPATSSLEYRWALRFSPFVRKRLSIGDLCYWLGEDPAMLGE